MAYQHEVSLWLRNGCNKELGSSTLHRAPLQFEAMLADVRGLY